MCISILLVQFTPLESDGAIHFIAPLPMDDSRSLSTISPACVNKAAVVTELMITISKVDCDPGELKYFPSFQALLRLTIMNKRTLDRGTIGFQERHNTVREITEPDAKTSESFNDNVPMGCFNQGRLIESSSRGVLWHGEYCWRMLWTKWNRLHNVIYSVIPFINYLDRYKVKIEVVTLNWVEVNVTFSLGV